MKILFITLEESARQNLRSILDDNFYVQNSNNIYTFGLKDNSSIYKDITNINIKSIMGVTNILMNIPYLLKLRLKIFLIYCKLFKILIIIDL